MQRSLSKEQCCWRVGQTNRVFDYSLAGKLGWREVGGRWSVVSGQWSVVSGQWSVVSGQWSVVSGQWSVVSGQWSVVSGQWSVWIVHVNSGLRCYRVGQAVAARTLGVRGGCRPAILTSCCLQKKRSTQKSTAC